MASVDLGNGDLCIMEGFAQRDFVHRVPAVKSRPLDHMPRINLTWRWIVDHKPGCPATKPGAEGPRAYPMEPAGAQPAPGRS